MVCDSEPERFKVRVWCFHKKAEGERYRERRKEFNAQFGWQDVELPVVKTDWGDADVAEDGIFTRNFRVPPDVNQVKREQGSGGK